MTNTNTRWTQRWLVVGLVFVWAAMTTVCLAGILPPTMPEPGQAPPPQASVQPRKFSFIHLSDVHVDTFTSMPEDLSKARSFPCVSTFGQIDAVPMQPYGISSTKPSFFIATGDNTEFGFSGVTADVLTKYFSCATQPVYPATGNHDNTWAPPTLFFKQRYGGENYSFDFGGCHFIAINSCTLQDPSPSFGEETIRFLKNDLRTRDNTTPVFIYCHHPLYGNEFASDFDSDRVLDSLRAYNVVAFLVGHGHSSVKFDFHGIPGVMGGSTFTNGKQPTEGYNIVNVDGDKLRIAYRRFIDPTATKPMLDRTIPKRANYPAIQANAAVRADTTTNIVQLSATINGTAAPLTGATWELDDEASGPLKIEGASGSVDLDARGILNGSHFVRFVFHDQTGKDYQRSTVFTKDTGDKATTITARWRYEMAGGCRSTPLVQDGRVYVGANDGRLYAIDAATGKRLWTFDAKAEVATSPAWFNGLVLFGAADGKFYAVTRDGKQQWVFDAKRPIFSSPVVDPQGTVYFGSTDAVMTALDAATGKLRWQNTDAQYSIESKPLLRDGKLYFGAWDGYVYRYNCADGKTDWKKPGTYNMKKVVRYYAPADASPVIANSALYVTDRGYDGGIYDLSGTFGGKIADEVTAFGVGADGASVLLRNTKAGVSKMDANNKVLWQSDVVAGRIPAAPIEQHGRVYVVTNRGELNVLNSATGVIEYSYRVTPRLYVMAAPTVVGNTVYVAGQDGVLTAVEVPGSKK